MRVTGPPDRSDGRTGPQAGRCDAESGLLLDLIEIEGFARLQMVDAELRQHPVVLFLHRLDHQPVMLARDRQLFGIGQRIGAPAG